MSERKELRGVNRLCIFLFLIFTLVLSSPTMAEFETRFASVNEFGVANQTVHRQLAPTYELLTGVFDRHLLRPIEFRRNSPPRVLYQMNDGYRVVHLNTSGAKYQQYTYQFAHELSHILTNFHLSEGVEKFKWFEESLAELASYYVLSEYAKQPPYIGGYTALQWQNYLKTNYDQLEQELKTARGLSIDDPIAPWFPKNERHLKKNATMRDLNWWMAWHMYPYFNQNPEIFWGACGLLNRWNVKKDRNFEQYLASWESVLKQRGRDTRPIEVFRFLFFNK